MVKFREFIKRHKVIIYLILFCTNLTASAQISGNVYDIHGEPIQGVTIVLAELPDTIILNVAETDSIGYFKFKVDKTDLKYLLNASLHGFQDKQMVANDNEQVGLILQKDEEEEITTLDDLLVVNEKPTVIKKTGEFVIRPNSYRDLAHNALDLLKFMPMIMHSGDDLWVLGNENSEIWLNGKRSFMSKMQLVSYLKSLSPHNIKEITIIQNIGSDNNNSIINVVLDRPEEGYLGNVNTQLEYSLRRVSATGLAAIWGSKDRFTFSMLVNGGYRPEVEEELITSIFKKGKCHNPKQ